LICLQVVAVMAVSCHWCGSDLIELTLPTATNC